jgi:hypothetical protein
MGIPAFLTPCLLKPQRHLSLLLFKMAFHPILRKPLAFCSCAEQTQADVGVKHSRKRPSGSQSDSAPRPARTMPASHGHLVTAVRRARAGEDGRRTCCTEGQNWKTARPCCPLGPSCTSLSPLSRPMAITRASAVAGFCTAAAAAAAAAAAGVQSKIRRGTQQAPMA